MYSSISLSLDGSKLGGPARSLALALARSSDARVTGLVLDAAPAERARLERLAAALGAPVPVQSARSPLVSPADFPFESKLLRGRPHRALSEELSGGRYDLAVVPALHAGEPAGTSIGPLTDRLVRRARLDTLVVKEESPSESDTILVCIDGSAHSYGGLMTAIELSKLFNKRLQAVAVYDPYLHYTLFNGIVNVLSEKASSVFKFKDQEKLHEEIIDTGLAKIYQAHLEVAEKVAAAEGAKLEITLLDGKAFEKIRHLITRRPPWLLVIGRIGVHSQGEMDIGATTENLLRASPSNVLLSSRTYLPPVDVKAQASVQWTPEAKTKMERVPGFVRGVATTAILRWATERGHSVITPSVINSAMGDLLPPQAAQAMGYVAEEVAIQLDRMAEGITFVCPQCGWAIRDVRPEKCSVCGSPGAQLEQIDRQALERLGRLEQGALEVEETFDGKELSWSEGAKEILRRVPSGFQRRRSKARIEKTAKVRGLTLISEEFALDVVQQDLAETSYLTPRGEALQVEIKQDERPDDATSRPREGSALLWTDAAWVRLGRVPMGFMREMTRQRVETFAGAQNRPAIDLALCEDGISEGRRLMAEMIGAYGYDGAAKEVVKKLNDHKEGAPLSPMSAPLVAAKTEAVAPASGCPMHAMKPSSEAGDHVPSRAQARVEIAQAAGCPFHQGGGQDLVKAVDEPAMQEVRWTEEAKLKLEEAAAKVAEKGKLSEDRAEELAKNAAEMRAKKYDMTEIAAGFMRKLGKQIGYGHPLSELTAEHQFEWTAEALARLERVPDFCRELTKWRVEWTAVKKDLGRVITPAIMDVKFDMWGEVSDQIMSKNGPRLPWAAETWRRIENIPPFVLGPVVQSVEGNAKTWGCAEVNDEVLDRVIKKWIDTGDFHEGLFGYRPMS